MYKFYQELQFLRNIITAITTGEIVWITNNSGNISTSQTLAVRNLIQKFRDGGITKAGEDKDAEKTPVLASSFNSISVQVDRTDFDFTDLLWKVGLYSYSFCFINFYWRESCYLDIYSTWQLFLSLVHGSDIAETVRGRTFLLLHGKQLACVINGIVHS